MGQLNRSRRTQLGQMLSWIRVQRGMYTRTALRDASGVSLHTLKGLEEGQTETPRQEILLKLDEALGLPPQTLISYARGLIDADTVRRVVGGEELPVWVKAEKPVKHQDVGNALSRLVEVIGALVSGVTAAGPTMPSS